MNKQNNTSHCDSASPSNKVTHTMNNSIPSSFSNLIDASKKDSIWIPKILMNIALPTQIQHIKSPISTNIDKTDIVPFIQKPSIILSTILDNELKYPKGCTFHFSGYDGPQDGNRLKKDIITAAAKGGTALVVAYSEQSKTCYNK